MIWAMTMSARSGRWGCEPGLAVGLRRLAGITSDMTGLPGARLWMPPEWHPHQRTLMAWPRRESWGDGWQQAEPAYAHVANVISEFEPVLMLVPPEHQARCAAQLNSTVELLPCAYDDAWMRDIGPTFLYDDSGNQYALSWNFNGWGDRFRPWGRDRTVAAFLAHHLRVPVLHSQLVLEGGAVHVDGQGALLVTAQSLFDQRRNPDSEQQALQQELLSLTGSRQLLLLPAGLASDHTHGHVDELACFAAPGTVLLHAPTEHDPDTAVCQQAQQVLRDHGLDIIHLPAPMPRHNTQGERLTLSYVNFYLANGVVVVPGFEQAGADANAAAIIAEQFPGRDVISCPALAIAGGGGGIHCITQQQPVPGPVTGPGGPSTGAFA